MPDNMREILIRVASIYGKRNNRRRKGNFLQIFKDKFAVSGIPVEVLSGKEKDPSTHLIVGDLKKADTVYMTGYDTSTMFLLPFPYYPLDRKKNSTVEVIDLIIRILCAIGVILLDVFFLKDLEVNRFLFILLQALISLIVILLVFGAASPYNFDRNTAAITLLYQCAVEKKGKRPVFIYVDNTIQKGAYGYIYIAELLKDRLKGKKVVILDCIANGEEIYCLHDEKTEAFFLPEIEGVSVKEKTITEEEKKNSPLREFEKAVYVVSGIERNGKITVKKTRTFFDSEVDIDRLEKLKAFIH